MKITAPVAKLLIFVVVTAIAGFGVAAVVGNFRSQPSRSYQAVFANASGLGNGEDVRIGGVPVGKVDAAHLQADGTALVDFTVDIDHTLTASTEARIRYQNLIGDRYLELAQGRPDPAPLRGPIPATRTTSALDLDRVVNGFRPLLRGLDPDQTNRLTASLIQVLNGRESAIGELVANIGSLTNTLADRDAAIGAVITNLDTTVKAVDGHRDNLSKLLDQLQQLIRGLTADQQQLTSSLDRIDTGARSLADVLNDNREPLGADIRAVGDLASKLNAQTDTLNLILTKLPEIYRLGGRAGGYGSFVNFFVCGLAVRYGGGPGDVTPMFTAPAERCK
ncbi:MlaD family protein [Nocardia wallacei]|uniref:MlaD family protein n=1 Tax=Nocardia wallacei TaxID=480035 RepID=UPI0024586ED5|nr:MlaD family protein [Nocardia wallacei]